MSLSVREKLAVQRELRNTKAAVDSAASVREKLALQRKRKELWAKLKVDSPKVETKGPITLTYPPGTNNNTILKPGDNYDLGNGYRLTVNGDSYGHPDIYSASVFQGDENAKATMTNTVAFNTNNVSFKRNKPTEDIRPITMGQMLNQTNQHGHRFNIVNAPEPEPEQVNAGPKTHRYSSSIADSVKPGDDILNAKMSAWTKKHKAQAALDAANLQGQAVVVGNDVQGWRIDVVKQLDAGRVLNVIEYESSEDGLTVYRHGVKLADSEQIYDLLPIAKMYDDSAKVKGDYVEMGSYSINEMAREKGFKLDTSALPLDGRASFDDGIEVSTQLPTPEPVSPAPRNAKFDRYLAGEFNGQNVEDFKATVREVYADGMSIDQVSTGVLSWFEVEGRLVS
ncbi:hypothetical protein [Thaumasiovibrio sp. DFM-14]|uniref:hypothetical protein n=1 Tax=Thaumasiovibrio sp. DFM-14 TaxID=3384792 RepID=UPI0039A04B92